MLVDLLDRLNALLKRPVSIGRPIRVRHKVGAASTNGVIPTGGVLVVTGLLWKRATTSGENHDGSWHDGAFKAGSPPPNMERAA